MEPSNHYLNKRDKMDLSALILESVEQKHKNEIRNYIGCSSIGHPCSRYLWYSYHNAPSSSEQAQTLLSFEIGKRLEDMILSCIEDAEIKVVRPNHFNHHLMCRNNDVPEFQGHMDAVIIVNDEPTVLEIKTAKSTSFQNFVKKGLKEWSPQYYSQLQSYIGMHGYKKGVLLAINKDTSELHHEWIDFDEYHFNELKHKAQAIVSAQEPPLRINKNQTYYICSRCKYKDTCFYPGLGE